MAVGKVFELGGLTEEDGRFSIKNNKGGFNIKNMEEEVIQRILFNATPFSSTPF